MSSPTFDGNTIFDSLDASSDNFSEGVLCVPSFSQITQDIHFEGEVGSFTLFHGYPNMEWIFEGLISATSYSDFKGIIRGIQAAIKSADSDTYKTLVDSFGNSYPNAQVRTFNFTQRPHIRAEGGYVAGVRITGIVHGNTEFGES